MSININPGTYPISWFLSAIGEKESNYKEKQYNLLAYWKKSFAFDIINNNSKEYISLSAALTSYTPYEEAALADNAEYAWYDSKSMTRIAIDNSFIIAVNGLQDEALDGLAKGNNSEANKLLKEAKDNYYKNNNSYPVYVKVTTYSKQS